jgi:hypothetical protein
LPRRAQGRPRSTLEAALRRGLGNRAQAGPFTRSGHTIRTRRNHRSFWVQVPQRHRAGDVEKTRVRRRLLQRRRYRVRQVQRLGPSVPVDGRPRVEHGHLAPLPREALRCTGRRAGLLAAGSTPTAAFPSRGTVAWSGGSPDTVAGPRRLGYRTSLFSPCGHPCGLFVQLSPTIYHTRRWATTPNRLQRSGRAADLGLRGETFTRSAERPYPERP